MRPRHCLPAAVLILALGPGCARRGPVPAGIPPQPEGEWKQPPTIQENISVQRCFAGGDSRA
jgi:hypothetical protein